ncbi:MFS transporter [Flaviflexus equikiangi]|uniref:MFS transporter n=1 Tax=Flaviflexus equikiangi TaxID=2758573 RepID=UPI001F0397D4|nr:MFS transporter [Flaviflexus equikiangi]
MPALSEHFDASPTLSAWTVSAATGALALAILPVAILSERFGRGRVMVTSAIVAVLIGVLLPFAPSLDWLIAGRAVQGLAAAGVPATAVAWLADEINGLDLPRAMGQYIAGNTVGGLLSRLLPSGVLEFAEWRWALASNVLLAAAAVILALAFLPSQQMFTPKRLRFGSEVRAIWSHMTNPLLLSLFMIGFLLTGAFVSLYNYLGYRLQGTFDFSPGLAGPSSRSTSSARSVPAGQGQPRSGTGAQRSCSSGSPSSPSLTP